MCSGEYTGTAGRIENAQVAVYLAYAARGGQALIDRELYLPRSWTDDPARCATAAVPAGVGFATKPALATAMLTRALDANVPARWMVVAGHFGDEEGHHGCGGHPAGARQPCGAACPDTVADVGCPAGG